jgi:hypothetical protein
VSEVEWNQAHYAMSDHLWTERVLLSAIVVNKPNVKTGKMEQDTLKGFIGAARLLNYPVTNEEGFLKEQQERVFAWARKERIPN